MTTRRARVSSKKSANAKKAERYARRQSRASGSRRLRKKGITGKIRPNVRPSINTIEERKRVRMG